jgi:hypothetical protein
VRPAVEAEKLGIPSVVVTVTGFKEVAQAAAGAEGVDDLRVAEYPGAVGVHLEEIRAKIKEILFDQIVDGLTNPVTRSSSGATGIDWNPQEIVLRGSWEQVNQFFFENEWTDGLAIIPPTLERVEKFLKYTGHLPDEEIAILPQANLKAIPWNIAANAVMAGCRPEHMAILIAAVKAMSDERYNLNNIGTTWGVVPFLLINGPIIKQLGIEYRGQLISRGPNPAIGRALGLIVRNIAGYRPGKNYMGTFGYPLPFALAENEEESPWEPFHVEHGFDRNSSTVTAGATITWGWPPSPYSRPDKSAAQSTLELLGEDLTKKPCLSRLAEREPKGMPNMVTLLLPPPVAKSLAEAGYSKQGIRDYLYEKARVPLRELEWTMKYGLPEVSTTPERVKLGLFSRDYLVGPNDLVRVLSSPEIVHMVVCGDPNRNRVMTLWSGYVQPVTQAIVVPENWDSLLEKAKD